MESQRHEQLRLQPQILREWVSGYDFQLKFVVRNREDVEEDGSGACRAGGADSTRQRPARCRRASPPTTPRTDRPGPELCLEKGYRFCNRLHIALFGNTKGT